MNWHVSEVNNKYQKCVDTYLWESFPQTCVQIGQTQIDLQLKCEEEITHCLLHYSK